MSRNLLTYHGIIKPFLMHTSAYDPRKNFEGLIQAFARLPAALRDAHQLVLVCKLSRNGRKRLLLAIEAAGLTEDDVILTGFVPDDELVMLYASCRLFVFPSFHEGFGLPALEAMCCGAAVVGSCLSSVKEVIGWDGAQFNPRDTEEMVTVISRALQDDGFRERLLAHGSVHAKTFSWDCVARRALDAMEQRVRFGETTESVPATGPFDMEEVIELIANVTAWPGPSDADLFEAADSLAKNEGLAWPQRRSSGACVFEGNYAAEQRC